MKKRELGQLIKKYLGTFFYQYDFKLYSDNIVYKISDSIFQGINFQGGSYDDSMTLNIFVMPLFERCEFVGWNIGKRIWFLSNKYDWWDLNCSEEQRKVIFEEVKDAIQQYALPWLSARDTAEKILRAEKWDIPWSFDLIHCALWDKNWDLAMEYLKRDDQWFEMSDDRRDWVVRQNKEVKAYIKMLEAKQFDEIEKRLKDNLAFSMDALQIEKKTKHFKIASVRRQSKSSQGSPI